MNFAGFTIRSLIKSLLMTSDSKYNKRALIYVVKASHLTLNADDSQ
jgi:hypothetical protein